MPRSEKTKGVPVIRESSSDGLIMLCVFEKGSVCPKNTIVLKRSGAAYVVKAKDNDSLTFKSVGCEKPYDALTKAYDLALETSAEIVGNDPRDISGKRNFTILFEGKSGKKRLINSKRFYNFVGDYLKDEYNLGF